MQIFLSIKNSRFFWKVLNYAILIDVKKIAQFISIFGLGVVRKLRHTKNYLFDPLSPSLSQIFQRTKNFVFGLSQIL